MHHSEFLVTGTLIAVTPFGVIITLDVKRKLKMKKMVMKMKERMTKESEVTE